MSGATGNIAAGATVTPPPRGGAEATTAKTSSGARTYHAPRIRFAARYNPTERGRGKAGWGLTSGRFRGTVGLLSEGTYDVVIEQFGPVELDRQSEYFMGSRKKTNHTGELEALGHALQRSCRKH